MQLPHLPVTDETRRDALAIIGRFVTMRSAPLLLSAVRWGSDYNKEVTESMSVVSTVLAHAERRGISRKDGAVSCLVVGDGTTPRTGALVALSTGWQVTSVDPATTRPGPHPKVRRLTSRKSTLEALPNLRADIVIGVHSHASVEATRAAVKPGGFLVVMPCCVPWDAADGATVTEAKGCLSPARWLIIEDA